MKFDYLIKGAGAMGMAFADIIFNESDLKFAIVDDRPSPGGHWNDSYPFVRLHQPSSFYGVNSTKLGQDKIDLSGKNAGLYELATKQEICSYYEEIMQKDLGITKIHSHTVFYSSNLLMNPRVRPIYRSN